MRRTPTALALLVGITGALQGTFAPTCAANVLPAITNVSVESVDGATRITYDVTDPDGDVVAVLLRVAGVDVGFNGPREGIQGDIGPGIAPGEGKVILVDREAPGVALPDGFIPRLLADDGIGLGGEMIHVDPSSGPDFMIDKYELTNEQFAAFVRSDGYEMMDYWLIDDGSIEIEETGWNYAGRFRWRAPRFWDPSVSPPWSEDPMSGLASTPVLGVSWFEAYAYCKWAGRRLPLSVEWQEAAGVGDGSYPWGVAKTGGAEPPDYGLANVRFGYEDYEFGGFRSDGHEYASPVGSHSPAGDSSLGVADAVGNVWEWCADVVAVVDYGTFSCATRPLKGGSWATAVPELGNPTKDLCPLYRTETVGFRCVR